MDVQVTVAGQITSKPTNNGGTKFDIPLSNGLKATTFDAALATKVSQLGGQPFTARIEQKPNPRGGNPYTNLLAAAGPGETLPPEIPGAGTLITPAAAATPFVPPAAGVAGATPIVPAADSGGNGRGFSEADKVRITKLAVLGQAYAFVSSLLQGAGTEALEEAKTLADDLARKLYIDARSHEPGAVPAAAAPVAAPGGRTGSAQAVAAFVAEQAGAPLVQVGAEAIVAPSAAEPAALPWGQQG